MRRTRAPFLWRDHYDLIDFFHTSRCTGRLLSPRPRLILDEETRDLLRYRRLDYARCYACTEVVISLG